MSNENTYTDDNKKSQRNPNNKKSNTENQSNSNALPRSDLRNEINKNNRKRNFDNIVLECQSGDIIESKCKIQKTRIKNKQVFTSDDLELYKEYVQWDFINNKLYEKCENLLNIRTCREKREFTNTLQKWFIFINEDYSEVPKYDFFTILPKIPVEHVAAQFLRKELIAKQFVTEKDANDKIIEILLFIYTNYSEVLPHYVFGPLNVEYDKDENILIVNKFQSLKAPHDKLLSDKNEIISTAKLLLREESLGVFHDKLIPSRDIDLYKEYVQWDFINNELYERGELLLNIRTGREKREFTNTLQRWFIFINEDYNEVPKYDYFTILPNIPLEHPAAQFLRDAIIEKKFANKSDADDKMRKILGFISRNHSQVVPHKSADPLYVKHDPDRKIVVVNKFQSEEQPRINFLIKRATVIATARMLLRYESLGNGSYQWGIQQEIREALHEKFNVRYEGFASPLNSGFIEYDDSHFCSLFPETDKVFGSIGNFFHVDMKKHAGGWSLNPPFLNDLMKKVAERVIKILDDDYKFYFFCTFPCWDDDEGWNILNDSRHCIKRFDLLPQHFKVQNAYGKHFKPYMKMNLFVMGNKKYICDIKLQELLSSLKLIYENSL